MKILVYFFIMLFNYRRAYYKEEIIPYYNKVGEVIKIDYNIKLNSNLKDYLVKVDVFGALREYKDLKKSDKVQVNINVDTKKKYLYVNDSFNLETDDFKKDKKNYQFLDVRGFDGKKINSLFIPWKDNLQEKEDDLTKIKKLYDYFYLEVLEFSYDDRVYYNMDNYKDINYDNGFKLYIRINNDNYKDIYKDYDYYGKVSFKLKRN